MLMDTRLELLLTRSRRKALADLADETGLSSADLMRLALDKLLRNPSALLGRSGGDRKEAA
jgi:hypothetical protein